MWNFASVLLLQKESLYRFINKVSEWKNKSVKLFQVSYINLIRWLKYNNCQGLILKLCREQRNYFKNTSIAKEHQYIFSFYITCWKVSMHSTQVLRKQDGQHICTKYLKNLYHGLENICPQIFSQYSSSKISFNDLIMVFSKLHI